MRYLSRLLLATSCAAFMHAAATPERPFLSPLFGEHMMLQREQPNRLWGCSTPGQKIEVEIAHRRASAIADENGRWQIEIDPPAAGGPYTLSIDGAQRLEFHDVLVGDIWLCSGQSNMEWSLAASLDGSEAVRNSTHENIRLFRVASQSAYAPALVPSGEWRRCEPAAFAQPGGFSAVAYYFARKLAAESGVPIGLIQAAVGGTPAESWMSRDALACFPEFTAQIAEMARLQAKGGQVYGNFVMPWYDEFDRGVAANWSAAEFVPTHWQTTTLHSAFTQLGVNTTPAVVWLRREITLPSSLPTGPAKLMLGVVEKMDTAWVNGRLVGASAWVENPRAYTLPPESLLPGKNVLALRVLKVAADGGFRSPADALKLVLGDGTAIPLEGEWQAAIGVDARPPHPLPLGYENWPTIPTVLQAGMLAPLTPIALKGAIWYQGEANFTRATQYRSLLPALVADWRALFRQPNLPFYVVQLPAFMTRRGQPGTDGWTELREAQAMTAHNVPHVGLAVTIDTGEADNIHPTDKQPVGERLALLALRDLYSRDVVASGPSFDRIEKLPGALRIHFVHTEGGLAKKGDRLGEFSVAGEDRVWHWANARIEGDTVIVSSDAVTEPTAVRYAWQANPLATLFNGAGLPAAPFRTDNWPLSAP